MFSKRNIFFVLGILFFVLFGICFVLYEFKSVILNENGAEKYCVYSEKTGDLLCLDFYGRIIQSTENTFTISNKDNLKVYVKKQNKVYELVQYSQVAYTSPKKIAILYIATGKYIKFWENFYQSMEKYFLPRHKKTYFLFTNHNDLIVPQNVVKVHQNQLPWPYITFKRFHFFQGVKDKLKEFDYIYFLNGTMLPVAEINEEILPTKEQSFMAALHPGYFRVPVKNLPYEKRKKSKAYIPDGEGKYYFMGGFNGGTSEGFLRLIDVLKEWVDADLQNNIIPTWHDESLLNSYVYQKLNMGHQPLILMPSYAIPQTGHKDVDELRPFVKQLILDKSNYGGHGYLRSND